MAKAPRQREEQQAFMTADLSAGALGDRRQPQNRNHVSREEAAGRLAIKKVPILPDSRSARAAMGLLRQGGYDAIDLIMTTGEDGLYRGVVTLQRLVEADEETPLSSLADRDWPTVTPDTDQEHAVECAEAVGASLLPVVAATGRPVGILTANILLDVLRREHHEDVHRFVGMLRERSGARRALESPPLWRVTHRLPWLLVGLALSTVATMVMASYEQALQDRVMIAFFIPALVYLADAVGTQTEAIAVRGLSLRRKPMIGVLLGEIVTGAIIGLILGAIALISVWAVYGDASVALGVGLSLFVAGTLACGIGLMLPWSLSLVGIDPAFGAGPVATIIQDLLTIIVYFVIMTNLVGLSA